MADLLRFPAGDAGREHDDSIALLNVKSLAAMLSVSVRSIWKMDASGKLPEAIRFAGNVRWRKDEIMAWIDSGAPTRERWMAMKTRK